MWFEMIEHFMLRCCWSKIQKLWVLSFRTPFNCLGHIVLNSSIYWNYELDKGRRGEKFVANFRILFQNVPPILRRQDTHLTELSITHLLADFWSSCRPELEIFSCRASTRFRVMASHYAASRLHSLDTPRSVGRLWKSNQPDVETPTW